MLFSLLGHDRYYNKYINVKKGGIGGVAMLLVGYVAISYLWEYDHISKKHTRLQSLLSFFVLLSQLTSLVKKKANILNYFCFSCRTRSLEEVPLSPFRNASALSILGSVHMWLLWPIKIRIRIYCYVVSVLCKSQKWLWEDQKWGLKKLIKSETRTFICTDRICSDCQQSVSSSCSALPYLPHTAAKLRLKCPEWDLCS